MSDQHCSSTPVQGASEFRFCGVLQGLPRYVALARERLLNVIARGEVLAFCSGVGLSYTHYFWLPVALPAEVWHFRLTEVLSLALTTLGLPGAHVLNRECSLRHYDLVEASGVSAGNSVLLNATLNRDGEVLVCSPSNVLNMIFGADSQFLIVKNISVVQDAVTV